ncbi:MAG: rod shape-determining protein MreD [Verrucomicrobia bacterium TMED175]|nr:MAG: rod shape-determining protein MreD [Verrucomicrobia bacterium TMED175]|tara:strand:- start:6213 stop:6695 length:483 start_codon:yes stop_codon:yes gene_type:complete
MRNIGITKFLIIIFISNVLESFIAPYLITFHVSVPITFLIFSYAIFKSNQRLNPLFAFLCGLYVDLISGSPFGLNAGLFTIMCYAINSYANTFKLFSYIQICIFFGISTVFYIGFKNLIMNLENFSYLLLFTSLLANVLLFLLISMLRYYFPSVYLRYDQ